MDEASDGARKRLRLKRGRCTSAGHRANSALKRGDGALGVQAPACSSAGSVCLSVCLSVRPSVCLSVCLSVCPSVFLSICPSVRPSFLIEV